LLGAIPGIEKIMKATYNAFEAQAAGRMRCLSWLYIGIICCAAGSMVGG
jgi:hypothetical protein